MGNISCGEKERSLEIEGRAAKGDKSYSVGVPNKYRPSSPDSPCKACNLRHRRQLLTQEIYISKLQAWLITLHSLWFSLLAHVLCISNLRCHLIPHSSVWFSTFCLIMWHSWFGWEVLSLGRTWKDSTATAAGMHPARLRFTFNFYCRWAVEEWIDFSQQQQPRPNFSQS